MEDAPDGRQRDKHILLSRVSALLRLQPTQLPPLERTLLQRLLVSASDNSSTSCSESACAVCVVAQGAPRLLQEVEAFLCVDAATLVGTYSSYLQDEPAMWLNAPPELLFAVCAAELLAPDRGSAARSREFVREAKLATESLPAAQPEEVFLQATRHLVAVLQQVRQTKPKAVFKELYRTLQAAIQPPPASDRPSSPTASSAHQDDPSDRPPEESVIQLLLPAQSELSPEDVVTLLLNVARIATSFCSVPEEKQEPESSYEGDVYLACDVVYAVALLLSPTAVAMLIASHLKKLRFASP